VTDPQSRPVPGAWTSGQPVPAPARPGPPVPAAPVPAPPVPAPPDTAAPDPGAPATPGPPPRPRAEGGDTGPDDTGPTRTEGTGDPRVDAALARLDRLDELPVAEHVGEYDTVHRALQDALTAIDES
jgi:hypothetical protein